jgi:hypothetical protein
MVKMTRERVEKLAHDLVEVMVRSRAVIFHKERDGIRQAVAHALAEEFRREEEREENVRRRLASMKKLPPRASQQWQELFRKMMEEEYVREGLDT